MGIIDFLKRKIISPRNNYDGQALFFKNGKLYKIIGNQENWYDPKYIVSDGIRYDLSDAAEILRIPIPDFGVTDALSGYGSTGMMDYVLRMKAAHCFNRNKKYICSALLWKSTMLMQANTFAAWKRSDYIRLVTWHYKLGMIDEAKKARDYLDRLIPDISENFDNIAKRSKNSVLQSCKNYNTDLVVFHHYGSGCCEECDKLSGRVYSISGKNAVFPKLPEYVLKNGNFHKGCRCMMSPYLGDKIYYRGKEVDAVKASTRPHKDGRTKKERENYELYLSKIQLDIEKEKRILDFYELQELFPENTPKTLSAYARMKSSNSKKFLELKEKALAYGLEI